VVEEALLKEMQALLALEAELLQHLPGEGAPGPGDAGAFKDKDKDKDEEEHLHGLENVLREMESRGNTLLADLKAAVGRESGTQDGAGPGVEGSGADRFRLFLERAREKREEHLLQLRQRLETVGREIERARSERKALSGYRPARCGEPRFLDRKG